MTFVPNDLPTEADDVVEAAFADYQAAKPDWVPADGNPEVVDMEVICARVAQTNRGLAQRLVAELELIGQRRGRPRRLALSAGALVRFVVAPGYVVEEGTQVVVSGTTFRTLQDAGGPGLTTLQDVPVEATIPGSAADGAVGFGQVQDLYGVDVVSVEMTTVAAGGQDEEDEGTYLDSLVDFLQLNFDDPTLVNARQYAIYLANQPGVARVLVKDLHLPAGCPGPDGVVHDEALDGVAGALGAYVIDQAGQDLPDFRADELASDVEARREANMLLSIGKATRTPLTIAYSYTTMTGADGDLVGAAGDAALLAYLDDASWGTPVGGDRLTYPGGWREETVVRFGELYAVLNAVTDLDHVESLTINGLANQNVALQGPAALPGAVTVTHEHVT